MAKKKQSHEWTPTDYFHNYFLEYERLILTKEGSRLSANDRYLLKSVFHRLQNLIIVYGK